MYGIRSVRQSCLGLNVENKTRLIDTTKLLSLVHQSLVYFQPLLSSAEPAFLACHC